MALESAERAYLRQFLIERFSLAELEGIAFDLGVDYELFRHDTLPAMALDLITYFERREELHSLVLEVTRQRPDDKLLQLLARLPPSSPRIKLQIVVDNSLVGDVEAFLQDLAHRRGLSKDSALVALAGGSIRLLISIPAGAATPEDLAELERLATKEHRIESIIPFDSLDVSSRQTWRTIAYNYPPARHNKMLRPRVSWDNARRATRRTKLKEVQRRDVLGASPFNARLYLRRPRHPAWCQGCYAIA